MLLQKMIISFMILEVYSRGNLVKEEPCAITCNCRNLTASIIRNTSTNGIEEYHPVVLVHGFQNSYKDMTTIRKRIQKMHNGTRVFNLNCYHGKHSSTNLWKQTKIIGQEILAIGEAFPNGIHLVGYSQGGLISRAVLQKFPKHNVRNFISISAPHLGIYRCRVGQPSKKLDIIFQVVAGFRDFFSRSFCNMLNQWKNSSSFESYVLAGSPRQIFNSRDLSDLYLKINNFLPVINKEISLPQKLKFKRGLLKLELMVLIGGPGDDIVDPWQSAHFGFFEKFDGEKSIVSMRNSTLYKEDLIGLKTLDKANRLILHTVPGIIHSMWTDDEAFIDRYVTPHLD